MRHRKIKGSRKNQMKYGEIKNDEISENNRIIKSRIFKVLNFNGLFFLLKITVIFSNFLIKKDR